MKLYLKKRSGILLVGSLVLLFSYQQCSDVDLIPKQAIDSLSSRMRSALPPPERRPILLRLVVFVDQSYSMIQGKCASDLDGKNTDYKGDSKGCKPEPGIDPQMHRYSAMEEWLDELDEKGNVEGDDIKIALIPFSGGTHSRPRTGENPALFKFRSMSATRQRLTQLRQEQVDEMKRMETSDPMTKSPPAASYMGTTAPRATIDFTYTVIKEEMKALEKAEALAFTPFQVIYMSDGVFKPLTEHWDKVWKYSRCDRYPDYPLCYDLRRDFRNEIGDVDENTFDNTAASLKSILNLNKDFPSSSLNLKFVKIHPDRVSSDDMNSGSLSSKYRNLFDEIKETISPESEKDKLVKIYSQFDAHRPFSIFSNYDTRTYKIDHFYIMNLNQFVNEYGHIVNDSDGDGLSDTEETRLGFAIDQPRSNGVCLDAITHLYGCKILGCDANSDIDGDGLNSCEEATLSTDPRNIDSDGDGIMDSHEAIRNLSPIKDERKKLSGTDSVTDHGHFLKGASPFTDLRQIPNEYLIQFSIDEINFATKADSQLTNSTSATEYDVQIDNIPIGNTASVEYLPKMTTHTQSVREIDLYPLGVSHTLNQNQVIYVVYVRSIQDPDDSYWLIKRMNVNLSESNPEFVLDLSKLKEIR
jgi:hypothetical protein